MLDWYPLVSTCGINALVCKNMQDINLFANIRKSDDEE